jgi:hypothetical protein
MAGIGKRLAGLLGSETVDKLKNVGTEALGDVIGTLAGSANDDKDKSSSAPPPSGKRFDEPAPAKAPEAVEATATATATVPATPSEPGSASVADKVIELNRLREQGVLSDAEFAALKAELFR